MICHIFSALMAIFYIGFGSSVSGNAGVYGGGGLSAVWVQSPQKKFLQHLTMGLVIDVSINRYFNLFYTAWTNCSITPYNFISDPTSYLPTSSLSIKDIPVGVAQLFGNTYSGEFYGVNWKDWKAEIDTNKDTLANIHLINNVHLALEYSIFNAKVMDNTKLYKHNGCLIVGIRYAACSVLHIVDDLDYDKIRFNIENGQIFNSKFARKTETVLTPINVSTFLQFTQLGLGFGLQHEYVNNIGYRFRCFAAFVPEEGLLSNGFQVYIINDVFQFIPVQMIDKPSAISSAKSFNATDAQTGVLFYNGTTRFSPKSNFVFGILGDLTIDLFIVYMRCNYIGISFDCALKYCKFTPPFISYIEYIIGLNLFYKKSIFF